MTSEACEPHPGNWVTPEGLWRRSPSGHPTVLNALAHEVVAWSEPAADGPPVIRHETLGTLVARSRDQIEHDRARMTYLANKIRELDAEVERLLGLDGMDAKDYAVAAMRHIRRELLGRFRRYHAEVTARVDQLAAEIRWVVMRFITPEAGWPSELPEPSQPLLDRPWPDDFTALVAQEQLDD